MSALEDTLALHIRAAGLPSPERELRFHDKRRWRFDFAWPSHMLALEVDGGTMGAGAAQGRHTRGKGFEADCIKVNTATLLGWRVLRVTGAMVRDGRALATLEEALSQAGQEAA